MIKKQWFSLAIVAVILVAYIVSSSGYTIPASIATALTSTLIACIFLLSGLTIHTRALLHSIRHWRAHILIQGTSFLLFPLVVIATGAMLGLSVEHNAIYIGFIVLACIPTTITSCVVFTRNAGGNEECALFNATLGNILGIVVTPLLIYLIIGRDVDINAVNAIKKLVTLVIVPFIIGQFGRNLLSIRPKADMSKNASNWMILTIMLIAFVNAFGKGIELSVADILYLLALSAMLRIFFLALVWYSSEKLDSAFTLADRKCLAITATQKTLALGLPIVAVLFESNPDLALISLPIIAYHTVQLFIDGIAVSRMAHNTE